MAAPKHTGDAHPAPTIDADIDFAGYDPYIVAITGGRPAGLRSDSAGARDEAAESRKVQLMAWLREHGR